MKPWPDPFKNSDGPHDSENGAYDFSSGQVAADTLAGSRQLMLERHFALSFFFM